MVVVVKRDDNDGMATYKFIIIVIWLTFQVERLR
jgi:hypothetical protein